MGGSLLVPLEIDCHVHCGVVSGLTGGDADDLLGEPALISLLECVRSGGESVLGVSLLRFGVPVHPPKMAHRHRSD